MSDFTPVTKTDKYLEIEILVEEEHQSPSDHFEDEKTVRFVENQIRRGNQWAWFIAHVKATYRGIITGDSYLGACSYKNEKDFKKGGYYDDMVDDAINQINEKLKTIAR